MSNNLLITDALVKELFTEASVAALYASERSVPKGALVLQRSARMAQLPSTNASTLTLLGRILHAGALAYGVLQLARPQTDVHASQTIAILKTLSLANSYYLLALAKPNLDNNPGSLQIKMAQTANDALKRIETYDPAFIFLVAKVDIDDNTRRVSVRGDGSASPLNDFTPGLLEIDPVQDYELVADGVTFPNGVLF
jgi:hypothetical protein